MKTRVSLIVLARGIAATGAFCDAKLKAALVCLLLGEADSRELGLSKKCERHEPIFGGAVAALKDVRLDDSVIVERAIQKRFAIPVFS